jgi:hypothetical protein
MVMPPADPGPGSVPPAALWRGWPEVRADLRSSVRLVSALTLAGVPAGLLWWALAPRADFRVTGDGPVVIGMPSQELLVAGDVVYTLVLAGLGLIAGAAAWRWRRRRGVATVVALALGAVAASLVAWQVGELLGSGPTEAELAAVGGQLTSALRLAALPALAVAPFTAVLAYVVGVLAARGDDLGREPLVAGPGAVPEAPATWAAGDPVNPDLDLVEAPPHGRPQA